MVKVKQVLSNILHKVKYRGGYRGERVQASDGEIIQAARHLARHYENAGKPVPPTLGVLT